MAHPVVNAPRVGVAVFLVKGEKVLLGKRKGSHGKGCFQLPGGHLEFGESWEECGRREVQEETGIDLRSTAGLQFATVTNDVFVEEGKHYITLFLRVEWNGTQEPELLEPEKCESWEWVPWQTVLNRGVAPLFLPLEHVIGKYDPISGHSLNM